MTQFEEQLHTESEESKKLIKTIINKEIDKSDITPGLSESSITFKDSSILLMQNQDIRSDLEIQSIVKSKPTVLETGDKILSVTETVEEIHEEEFITAVITTQKYVTERGTAEIKFIGTPYDNYASAYVYTSYSKD